MFKFLSVSLMVWLLAMGPVKAQGDAHTIETEAFEAMKKQDWKLGVEKFRQVNTLQPNNANVETSLGWALMKDGQYAEAIEHLLHAKELKPDAEMVWMNLSAAYQATGQLAKEIDAIEHFLKITNNPEERQRAEGVLNQTREALKREDIDNSQTDYLKSVVSTDGTGGRWPEERQPVKVYIADGTGLTNFKPEYVSMVEQCFKEWQAASGERVRFQFVPNKTDASIDVRWVTDASELKHAGEAGECNHFMDDKGLKIVHVGIGLFDPRWTPEKVRYTTLHEIGHAVGFGGHSLQPGDAMYIAAGSVENATPTLSARDKETIRRFYSEDIGENWLSLANRGNQLLRKQDFKGAVECYSKALQFTAEPIVRSNLVLSHISWAQNAASQGNIKTAEEQFKAALKLEREKSDAHYSRLIQSYADFLRSDNRDAEAVAIEKSQKQ